MARLRLIPTIRGLAYLACANFIARIILFLDKLANSFFSYEMVLLYSAHLDTQILLFFQGVFMLPVALLGVLVFYGIEKQSFNLVLYPTLMLLFLILLRYGAEMALLIIHWEEHSLDRGPSLIFYSVLDLLGIIILLSYVYMSLAAPPTANSITPSRLNSLRRKLQRLSSKGDLRMGADLEAGNAKSKDVPKIVGVTKKKNKKPPAVPPNGEDELLVLNTELDDEPGTPPPRPPPSPKFNYKLRRNVAHLVKDEDKLLAQELEKQRQRNSPVMVIQEDKEGEESAERDSPTPTFTLKLKTQSLKTYDTEPKRRSLIIETDLDEPKSESPGPSHKKEDAVQEKNQPEKKFAQDVNVNVDIEPDHKRLTAEPEMNVTEVEQESVTAEPELNIKPTQEDDDGSEWEYEYEVEADVEEPQPQELQKQEENIIRSETKENLADQDLPDDNVYQPETTTSSTGYKTTAV